MTTAVPQIRRSRNDPEEYARSLTVEERRLNGRVYTPVALVRLVLDLACYSGDQPIERSTILDPACGGGVFVIEAVSRLLERLATVGHSFSTRRGREAVLGLIETLVFGVDIDPEACRLTRRSVRELLREKLGPGAVPPGFFSSNIRSSDFLESPQRNLFTSTEEHTYDFIVGNPPYVATTRLTHKAKTALRARFHSAHGRIDLYSLFIERATEILSPAGTLAFITPDKYLTSNSARRLRHLIAERAPVVRLARSRSHRIFPDAATVPCITICQSIKGPSKVEVLELGPPSKDSSGLAAIVAREQIARPQKNGDSWDLVPESLKELTEQINRGHPPLISFLKRLSAGIASGRDGVYVLPEAEAGALESDLLHSAVRGQDIAAFGAQDPHLKIIVPYHAVLGGRPELVDLTDFPRTRDYLGQFRRDLERRHCVKVWRKPWFDLHDPWPFDVTASTKILCPDVAANNRFALDEGRFCPLHSAYYMIPARGCDPLYVVALLNSRPFEFVVRLYAPIVKDGFSRYRRQFLATLPVPSVSASVRERIVRAHMDGEVDLRNELVSRIFDLSTVHQSRIDVCLRSWSSPHTA